MLRHSHCDCNCNCNINVLLVFQIVFLLIRTVPFFRNIIDFIELDLNLFIVKMKEVDSVCAPQLCIR